MIGVAEKGIGASGVVKVMDYTCNKNTTNFSILQTKLKRGD